MAKDLLENLFDSIDLIVTNKLGDLNYDKTEQCTIQEVKGNNEYYVSNGAAKYVAYAQNDAQYKEGDSVYVTIPQGNYNNQKLIIGKHTAKKSAATDWVSPMENFVNITGSINPSHEKTGLIANSENNQVVTIWEDNSKQIYKQYDRLCITGDFSTGFSDLVIDGSYGLILTGTIKDTRLESELATLEKQRKEIQDKEYTAEVEKEKLAAIDKKIADVKEKYKTLSDPQTFACILDAKDMLGNPYDFAVPFKQEKLIEIEPTSEISNLQIKFYQGLSSNQEWSPTFIGVNNELIAVEEKANLFVENVTINFGYSYENYSDETAVLYTLDKTTFNKDEGTAAGREMRLRWVHYDDNQKPHSIRDINDNTLRYHYAKVRWYRYKIDETKTEPDPLAGYFWEEIKENENKFDYKVGLNTTWQEEKFKVIIQFDDKLIKSQELVFSNPEGVAQYGKLITGLEIKHPENDKYKGTFYIYGDDYNAGISTEKTFDLIAEYQSIDTSNTNKTWENTDVICWKFPAYDTMIHKPEKGFEIFNNDEFLDAEGSVNSVEVNGVTFTKDKLWHQVIRRITVDTEGNSLESRTQKYRVKGMFNGGSNNKIKCEVYKPEVNMVHAEKNFTFGLHTTNGTKYTLAVDWVETAGSGTYQRPPAITAGDTKSWKFSIKILDANQTLVAEPEGGWKFNLSWFEDRGYGIASVEDNIFNLNGDTLEVIASGVLYINNAQYQILQIQTTNFADYNLTTRLPIPIRSTRDIVGIEGPDRIYYDSAGYNPRWNDEAYKLIWKPGTTPIANSNWGIKDTGVNTSTSQKPQIEVKDNNSYLRAPDTYLPPSSGKYDGVATFTKIKDSDTILWIQPIYVTMDAYGSQFFNEWDGKMKIDEASGTIMGSVIGVGKKDDQNRYSGVVLGEVGKVDEDNNYIKDKEGILGYHEGVQSFSLLNDGTATFGKSGMGQIQFNGNNATIQSGNYEENKTGMQIDLDDGKINANNFQLNSSKVWIDSTAENGYYLKVADTKDAENAYFQVSNSNPIVKMGKWELDNKGQFKGLNNSKYTLMAPPGSNTGNWVFASGSTSNSDWGSSPFRVNEKGEMYASQGTVGGWNIMPTYIDTFSGPDRNNYQKRLYLASHADSSSYLIYAQGEKTDSNGTVAGYERKFSVDENGKLYAKDADIAGKITATDGEIKNCDIGDCNIGDCTITGTFKVNNTKYSWKSLDVVTSIDDLTLTFNGTNVLTAVSHTNYELLKDHLVDIIVHDEVGFITYMNFQKRYLRLIDSIKVNYSTAKLQVLGGSSTGTASSDSASTDSVGAVTNAAVGGGCFEAGSQVLMFDYSWKNIEDIKIGDIVISYNEKTMNFENATVTDTYIKYNTKDVIDVYFNNGKKLGMTTCHPILSTAGWKSLNHKQAYLEHRVWTKDLMIGNKIKGFYNDAIIEKISYRKNVDNYSTYNITVPKNKNYIVNGFIVHNALLKPGTE